MYLQLQELITEQMLKFFVSSFLFALLPPVLLSSLPRKDEYHGSTQVRDWRPHV